jgi:hypothetical protein
MALIVLGSGLEAAEKRARVKFSDSKDGVTAPDVTLPSPILNGAGLPRVQGGGSLDGVTAMPFAPSVVGGSAPRLFRRDREGLDSRNSWISEVPEGVNLSEERINRAFGVRTMEKDAPMEGLTKQGGAWAGLRGKSEAPATVLPPRSDTGADTLASSRSAFASENPSPFDTVRGSTEGIARGTSSREMNPVIFSDSDARDRILRGNLDGWGDNRVDLTRDPMNNALAPAPVPRSDARSLAREEQFRRILGVEAVPRVGGGGTEVGLRTDPLGVQPDPTRREMNPVAATPALAAGGSSQPLGQGVLEANSPGFRMVRPSWAESPLTRKPDPSKTESVLPTAGERRRTMSPTVLEMPRRAF